MDAKHTPLSDRFDEAFSDYWRETGFPDNLKPFAEAIYFSGYKVGYEHARLDAGRIMEVEFAKVRAG